MPIVDRIVYEIPFSRGGFNYNPNIDKIPPESMVEVKNINMEEMGRAPRGGTSHVDSSAMSDRVMGIFDFRLRAGTQHIVRATADGKLFRDDTNEIQDATLASDVFVNMEVFNNELYFSNGANTPRKWTGAGNTAAMTAIPSDWTGSDFPKQFVRHSVNNLKKLVALAMSESTQNIYIPKTSDGVDFDDASVVVISIETGDGTGIVGGVDFGGRLIAFSKREAFIVDDSDSDSSKWYYRKAQWDGGVAHERLIIKTPNDLICMMENGEIYSVRTAEQYGDYKTGSISRPPFVDRWIRENLSLTSINNFHGVYDPKLRAVKFFVERSGASNIDTSLVYFIDRPPEEAWSIHDNQINASGYSASASAVIRKDVGEWVIYTGDFTGRLWELETNSKNDNGNGYYAGFKTPHLPFDEPRMRKHYKQSKVIHQPKGSWNLTVNILVDGKNTFAKTVDISATGGTLPFTLGTDLLGGIELLEGAFSLRRIGKRIQFEMFNSNADEDFFLSSLQIDHKPLGVTL